MGISFLDPKEAVIAVTYDCNAKCVMCNIWRYKKGKEVASSIYKRLPPSLRTINISGGEPFLRQDLPEIIDVIDKQCKNPRIVISTNGLEPKLIEMQTREISRYKRDIGVRISVDGMEAVHDKIRGTNGAFLKGVKSVKILKEMGISDLGIAFTVIGYNLSDIREVYRLSRELQVEFAMGVAYNSSMYFDNMEKKFLIDFEDLDSHIQYITNRELKSWKPKKWFRAYFERGLVHYNSGKKSLRNCGAGKAFFYLDPLGNVYPCNVLDKKLGNLQENSFDDLWNSMRGKEVRDLVGGCRRNCWIVCNAGPLIKRRPYIPFFWVMMNKLKAHLGKNVT